MIDARERFLLGTRFSDLALTQSTVVAGDITERTGIRVQLEPITTRGDVERGPLVGFGGTGVFVSAVRDALLHEEVDLAVHSMKDLPTAEAPGIYLGAVPPREAPYDVLCGARLCDLPAGARVGTGSPRRAAQLLAVRPDLSIEAIRGNVDTRLAAVDSGRVDAVVLASAGLTRLSRRDAIAEVLDSMLPAAGQGALAVECRLDDEDMIDILSDLDDLRTRAEVTAERAVLATLQAGCAAPVGTLACWVDDTLLLRAGVFAEDGSAQWLREQTCTLPASADTCNTELVDSLAVLDAAARLGDEVAQGLLADGAPMAAT